MLCSTLLAPLSNLSKTSSVVERGSNANQSKQYRLGNQFAFTVTLKLHLITFEYSVEKPQTHRKITSTKLYKSYPQRYDVKRLVFCMKQ